MRRDTLLAAACQRWAGEQVASERPQAGSGDRAIITDQGVRAAVDRARRERTPEAQTEAAGAAFRLARNNVAVADYLLEGWGDRRPWVGQNVNAERDAFVAGRDIHVTFTDKKHVPYPPAPAEAAQSVDPQTAEAIARVVRDLDRVSRGRDVEEGVPAAELQRLIQRAVETAMPWPAWSSRLARMLRMALRAIGVPVRREATGRARRLRDAVREQGIDPRVLIPGLSGHGEMVNGWLARDEDLGLDGMRVKFRLALADELCRSAATLLPGDTQNLLGRVLSPGTPIAGLLTALDRQFAASGSTRRHAPARDNAGLDKADMRRLVHGIRDVTPRMTGRAEEVERIAGRIRELLAQRGHATVFLSGQPGVGKSELARAVAKDLAERFPDGTLYFDMGGASSNPNDWMTPQHVADDVLTILGGLADPADDDELYALYAAGLQDRRVLVVLDNALDMGHVQPLLRQPATSCFIVTSRDRGVPAASLTHVDLSEHVRVLDRFASIDLLMKYVEDCGRPGSGADEILCAQVADYCDDLPLALNLVGDQVLRRYGGDPTTRLRTIIGNLEAESKRLGEIGKGLGVAISVSYINLDDTARHVFRMSCTTRRQAITGEELGHCLNMDARAAGGGLSRLVDGSLAAYDDEPARSAVSFTLHQTVRLFADWRRDEDESEGTIKEFKRRFVEYIRVQGDIADEGPYPDPDDPSETAVVMNALELAEANGWADEGIAIAERLVRVLPAATEMQRLQKAHQSLVSLYVSTGQAGRAVAAWMAFAGRMKDNRAPEAIDAYKAAQTLADQWELPKQKAEAGFALGILLGTREDLDAAFEAMTDAASTLLSAHKGQLPGEKWEVLALPVIGNCVRLAARRSDLDEEIFWAELAGGIARRRHDAALEDRAHAMLELGLALWSVAPPEAAQAYITAGQWFERDGQFVHAAIAASNAAYLVPPQDKQELLRTAVRRWGKAQSPDDQARHAAELVRLSAFLARQEELDSAIEELTEASEALPDDPKYMEQANEIRMRRLALRILTGVSPRLTDFSGIRETNSLLNLRDVFPILHGLAASWPPGTEERDKLYSFVREDPRNHGPAIDGTWLHEEMGRPRPTDDWPSDDIGECDFPA